MKVKLDSSIDLDKRLIGYSLWLKVSNKLFHSVNTTSSKVHQEVAWMLNKKLKYNHLIIHNIEYWDYFYYHQYLNDDAVVGEEILTLDEFKARIVSDKKFLNKYGVERPCIVKNIESWGDYSDTSGSLLPPENGETRVNQLERSKQSIKYGRNKEVIVLYNPSDFELEKGSPISIQLISKGVELFMIVTFNYFKVSEDYQRVITLYSRILTVIAKSLNMIPGDLIIHSGILDTYNITEDNTNIIQND